MPAATRADVESELRGIRIEEFALQRSDGQHLETQSYWPSSTTSKFSCRPQPGRKFEGLTCETG